MSEKNPKTWPHPMPAEAKGDVCVAIAATVGNAHELREMLAAGCNPNATFFELRQTPLTMAVKRGNLACVEMLAPLTNAHSADLRGMTALHYAAWAGMDKMAEILVPLSDVNQRCMLGRPPAFYALTIGRSERVAKVLRLLVDADWDLEMESGETLLDFAQSRGWQDIASEVLERKCLREAEQISKEGTILEAGSRIGPKRL